MVTAAAAIFLGEQVGLRRASAILIGFLGALLIVQPASATFDVMTSLVFISAVGMTLRDVGTKLVHKNFSTLLLLSFYYVCYLASVAVFYSRYQEEPAYLIYKMTLIFSAMIALGSLGVIFMTEAVRLGDMSVVSPFRYTRLLFSMAAGIFILGEQVNAIMLFGSTLTILSGLYIWRREILFKQ